MKQKELSAATTTKASVSIVDQVRINDLEGAQKKSDINFKEIVYGKTLLQLLAVYHDNVPFAEWLIENDVDVNAQSETGRTALGYACCHGLVGLSRRLLELDAKLDIADDDGYYPLHYAATSNIDLVVLLLKNGSQSLINEKTKNGATPLQLARMRSEWGNVSFLEICELLHAHGGF